MTKTGEINDSTPREDRAAAEPASKCGCAGGCRRPAKAADAREDGVVKRAADRVAGARDD